MIHCPELDKKFADKEAMFAALKTAAPEIIAQKKAIVKHADSYQLSHIEGVTPKVLSQLKHLAVKSFANKSIDFTKELNLPNIIVKATTNTTNWFDSHRDVHIDGIWNKTLADNGPTKFPHIQEHEYEFEKMINDTPTTSLENTTFKALGFNYEGTTQALKVVSVIDPNRNIFMYNQYANKWVKNHSVGMRYVKLLFCANSEMESMAAEKSNWDKYYPVIANKADVDEVGYFWAVLEAKLVEHSAVVFGSNCITPTDSVEIEAEKSTADAAAESLQSKSIFKNLNLKK